MFFPSDIWRLPIKFINTAKSTICKNKGPSFQHPLSWKQINNTKWKKVLQRTQHKRWAIDWSAYLHPSLQLQSIQHLCFLVLSWLQLCCLVLQQTSRTEIFQCLPDIKIVKGGSVWSTLQYIAQSSSNKKTHKTLLFFSIMYSSSKSI